jgi:hypothetical protein
VRAFFSIYDADRLPEAKALVKATHTSAGDELLAKLHRDYHVPIDSKTGYVNVDEVRTHDSYNL